MTATTATPARIRTWTPVHTDGYHCDRLEFDLDHGEHQRRQACGLGAIPDFRAINIMLELPGGHSLDYDGLSEMWRGEVRWLERRYPGALDVNRSGWNRTAVTRLASPILRPDLAIVEGKRYTKGHMNRAAHFAPQCRRAVVYSPAQAMKADSFQLAEHDFCGVGLGQRADDGGIQWLVQPRAYHGIGYRPARWWFAETVYAEWLKYGESMGS